MDFMLVSDNYIVEEFDDEVDSPSTKDVQMDDRDAVLPTKRVILSGKEIILKSQAQLMNNSRLRLRRVRKVEQKRLTHEPQKAITLGGENLMYISEDEYLEERSLVTHRAGQALTSNFNDVLKNKVLLLPLHQHHFHRTPSQSDCKLLQDALQMPCTIRAKVLIASDRYST